MSTKIQHQDMTFVQRLLSDVRQLIKMPYRPADIEGDEEAEVVPKVYIMIDSSIMAPSSDKEYILSQAALNYLVRRLVIGARQAGAEVVIKRADTNVDDVQMAGTMIRIPPRKMALNAKAVDSFIEDVKDKEMVAAIILITDGTFRNIQSLMWTGEPYMHRRLFVIGTPELEERAEEIDQLYKKTGMKKPGKDEKAPDTINFKSRPVYVLKPKEIEQLDQNAEATKDASDEELMGKSPRMPEPAGVTEAIERRKREMFNELVGYNDAIKDAKFGRTSEKKEELGPIVVQMLKGMGIVADAIGQYVVMARNAKDESGLVAKIRENKAKFMRLMNSEDLAEVKRNLGMLANSEKDIAIFPVGETLKRFVKSNLFKQWAANEIDTLHLRSKINTLGKQQEKAKGGDDAEITV